MKDIKLYPHNQKAYKAIIEGWKTSNKVAVCHATGTGKSYLILKCIFDNINKRKLVLAPSTFILEQLQSLEGTLPNTTLMTYAKLKNLSPEEIEILNCDMIIFDEFHRCGAETWGRGVNVLINTYTDAKILGLSATPIRYLDNERDMSDEIFDGNVVSTLTLTDAIANEILPVPKYISALYTLDYEIENYYNKIAKCKNSDEEKKELYKELNELKKKLNNSKGIASILKKYIVNLSGKYIIFCRNKEHLDEMTICVTRWFEEAYPNIVVDIYTLYALDFSNNKQLFDFTNNKSGNIKLLFTIDMLNEGIHASDISGVILLRPTESPTIYYQQIGRALQVDKQEHPLIFDLVNNIDNTFSSKFKKDLEDSLRKRLDISAKELDNTLDEIQFYIIDETLDLQEALSNLEEKFIDKWEFKYNLVKEYQILIGALPQRDVIYKDVKIGDWVSSQKTFFVKGWLSDYKTSKLVELGVLPSDGILGNTSVWDYKYSLCEEYLKNGNKMTKETIYKGEFIGNWLYQQNTKKIIGTLESDRVNKLESLGLLLTFSDRWNYMYDLCLEYKKAFKVTPSCATEYKGVKLGVWLTNQKQLLRKNKLSEEHKKALVTAGFILEADNLTRSTMWENKLKTCLEFQKSHKEPITSSTIFNDIQIGTWLVKQKSLAKKGKLSEQHFKKLLSSNLINEEDLLTLSDGWERNLQACLEFYSLYNKPVNCTTVFKGLNLGCWLNRQRVTFNRGKLSQDRVEKLKDAGLLKVEEVVVDKINKNKSTNKMDNF